MWRSSSSSNWARSIVPPSSALMRLIVDFPAMDPRQAPGVSSAAKAAFAGLLARLEAGEGLDLEAEFGACGALAPELRMLHQRWQRLQGTLAALEADSDALDSTEEELRARFGGDPAAEEVELKAFAGQPFEERYEPRGPLGRGGMGVVERVFDRALQREVAVKRLRRTRGSALRRFLAEARLVAALDHPGLVPVHDAGLDARGRPWFTMPLVSGTSLAVVLALARDGQGGWSRERVLGVLQKTCEIVAYAHARGVVHRDLKPANVMLGAFGEVLVLDWGLALLAEGEPHARRGALLGTPAYMPPEQAAGEHAEIGPQSDVYAIGAILYHLLAGRAPYAEVGPSNEAVARAVRSGGPVPLELVAPHAPSELVAICARAMARESAARYAGMGELAADLRAFLEGRVVQAHARGAWAELRKWVGRNRALAGALSVIVLLLALALSLSLYNARARHAWSNRRASWRTPTTGTRRASRWLRPRGPITVCGCSRSSGWCRSDPTRKAACGSSPTFRSAGCPRATSAARWRWSPTARSCSCSSRAAGPRSARSRPRGRPGTAIRSRARTNSRAARSSWRPSSSPSTSSRRA